MKVLTNTIGRIVFGLPFIVFGIFHFMKGPGMAGYVPSFIPGGVFWVYFVGIALIAAGVAIIANRLTKLAGILLAVLLLIFVLTIHLPGVIGGSQMSMTMLLKDVGLAGGALLAADAGK